MNPASGEIILADGRVLTALKAVRVIPHRRWVFSAYWHGQPVFAKVFLGEQAGKYAQRDAQGVLHMQQAGLATPALLWQGLTENGRAHVLVYAAVVNANNAETLYRDADTQTRLSLVQHLAVALARQHQAGLVQTDLHLKNFLVAEATIWAIDGDGIKQQTLTARQAYQQLAELMSKFEVLDQQHWAAEILQAYDQQRGWPLTLTAKRLLDWARAIGARKVSAYVERKIFRNCTDVAWLKTSRYALALSSMGGLGATDDMALEEAMRSGQPFKQGNTCTVVHALLQTQAVVIKRYNIKGWLHALSRAWRPSRAAASWSNAHRLQSYGIATPQPLAMLETRYYGLRGRAYFISAYSPWPDAFRFFREVTDVSLRHEAIIQLVTVCYRFYLLRISHGDMKATNFQINIQGQVIVMDMDSMQQHRCARRALRAHVKDIRRLLQNWKDDTSLYNALLESFNAVYVDQAPLKLAGISI